MALTAADLLAWVVLGVLLAAITAVDLQTQRIPNVLNALLLLGGLLAAGLTPEPRLAAALAGVALGGVFLLAVAMAFRAMRGREGLGLGDVKFLAAAGAWVGWTGIGPLVFVAAVAALLVLGVQRLAGMQLDRHRPIAFGPYLCLALLVVRALQEGGAPLLT